MLYFEVISFIAVHMPNSLYIETMFSFVLLSVSHSIDYLFSTNVNHDFS
jgi:hypothetical protein